MTPGSPGASRPQGIYSHDRCWVLGTPHTRHRRVERSRDEPPPPLPEGLTYMHSVCVHITYTPSQYDKSRRVCIYNVSSGRVHTQFLRASSNA